MKTQDIITKIFYLLLFLGAVSSITLLVLKLQNKDGYQNVSNNKEKMMDITLSTKSQIYCPNNTNSSCDGICSITERDSKILGKMQFLNCKPHNLISVSRKECDEKCKDNAPVSIQTFESHRTDSSDSGLRFYCGNSANPNKPYKLIQNKNGTYSCV